MRNAFIDELISLASTDDRIVLVVGDLGFSVVEAFANRFPKQFINAGVAEQNMMGLAAGLASEGHHVFVYSIANFPTFRCAEQIRNDVDYHKLPVTIVCIGGGLAYGSLGYSHHAVQDYGLMRLMPNILIASPGDPMEVRACVRYLVNNPQPSYLRLGKAGEPCLHSTIPTVEPGQWLQVYEGGDGNKTLLTTGASMAYADHLIKENYIYHEYSLSSLPLWGMSTKEIQKSQIRNWVEVVTIEDHLHDGGFGSWIFESLIETPDILNKIRVKALSSEVCGMVGSQKLLNKLGGLS